MNKKINVPLPPARKTPLDFCYVAEKQGSIPLVRWLAQRSWQQARCGLVAIPNMRDVYGLYYDSSGQLGFSGIVKKETANEVALSSVPKGMDQVALLSFNKDAYSMHCRDYRDYQTWQEQRNEARYRNTLAHGKNYDAKNMMHTIRLLDMAAEILEHGVMQVRRPNREHLLAIRNGVFEYDALMEMAEAKLAHIETLYGQSHLPKHPDKKKIEDLLVAVRERFYFL